MTMVPQWFFTSLMNPLQGGYTSLVPAAGALCFAAGVLLSLLYWRRQLLLFLIPLTLSLAVVAGSGYMRGEYDNLAIIEPGMLAFVATQALLAVMFAYKAKAAWLPGIALAAFSVSHAMYAAKIATMALTDTWV
ncbi:MAG: hypothetical protein GY952_15510 [Rhodobacteraceae bacterium]|nr:hypothetical protein [Paracoccaceae bacterium]